MLTTEQDDQIPITPLVPPTPVLPNQPTDPARMPPMPASVAMHLFFMLALLGTGAYTAFRYPRIENVNDLVPALYLYIAPLLGAVVHGVLAGFAARRVSAVRPLAIWLPAVVTLTALVPLLSLLLPYAINNPLSAWTTDDLIAVFIPIPSYVILNAISLLLMRGPNGRI